MSLLETIVALSTGTYTVTRQAAGTMATGIYTPGAVTTFTIIAAIQPATGIQRVVGGRDQRSDADGQTVWDVRVLYTATELLTRTPANEPDVITYDGGQWTVFRMERYDAFGETYFRATLTRKTSGAS